MKKAITKLIKSVLCASLLITGFALINSNKVSAKEEPTVEPYALVRTVTVNEPYTITKTLYGNSVTFTTYLKGEYMVSTSGGVTSVINVNLAFAPVTTNNEAFVGRVIDATKLNNDNSVTVQFTIQYRMAEGTTWTKVVTDTIIV